MGNILITGTTGKISFEEIRFISKIDSSNRIIAGFRNIEKAKYVLKNLPTQLNH
jgi:hypothetical protein